MHQMDLGIGPYLFDALVLAYDPSCPLISKNSQKKEQQTHTQKKDGKRPIKRMRREDNEEQECEKEKENDDTEQREEEENDHDERREGHDEVSEPQEEEETLAPRRRKVRKKNQGMRALSLSEKLNYRYSKIHKFSCGVSPSNMFIHVVLNSFSSFFRIVKPFQMDCHR
jgi:magnesium-transporting ATPase (P-type)